MKKLEVIAPKISSARTDVVELLKPLPKPKPVIHVVTCNPPVLVVDCTPKPEHTVVIQHEAPACAQDATAKECAGRETAAPVHEVEAVPETTVEPAPVIEVEAPKHPVEVIKDKAERAIDQSCETCGDGKVVEAEAADEESGPPGDDETSGPVLNVNAKIKKAAQKA